MKPSWGGVRFLADGGVQRRLRAVREAVRDVGDPAGSAQVHDGEARRPDGPRVSAGPPVRSRLGAVRKRGSDPRCPRKPADPEPVHVRGKQSPDVHGPGPDGRVLVPHPGRAPTSRSRVNRRHDLWLHGKSRRYPHPLRVPPHRRHVRGRVLRVLGLHAGLELTDAREPRLVRRGPRVPRLAAHRGRCVMSSERVHRTRWEVAYL